MKLVGDFETTTNPNDCRVWASCLVDIETLEVVHLDNNLDTTMDWFRNHVKDKTNGKLEVYYHNLKFDGEFILSWLYRNGYKYDAMLSKAKTFRTLITDTGIFYKLEINFYASKNNPPMVIKDSLKVIPRPVKDIPKMFGLKALKGEIEYTKERPIGYQIDSNEEKYIIDDCKIVAQALAIMHGEGLTKMTIASNAVSDFKTKLGDGDSKKGNQKFRNYFPILDRRYDGSVLDIDLVNIDDFIRKSYKGGYVYADPRRQNKLINQLGCTYDVNSLYPSQMHSSSGNLLPYDEPFYFKGEYRHNPYYPLYIQRVVCKFKLRKGFVPIIQLKNNSRFVGSETEYLKSSGYERVELFVTNVDWEMYNKHYIITEVTFIDGYMFKGRKGFFDTYIDYWNGVKVQATKDGNEGLRSIAKLMLNSLYGKFATNPKSVSKIPLFVEGDTVSLKLNTELLKLKQQGEYEDTFIKEDKEQTMMYTAMASFITAYARRVTQIAIQENYDNFCYADTDSIHLLGETAINIDIDNEKLGAWKHEGNWENAKFIRAKTYFEELIKKDGLKLDVKCAGMPDNIKKCITKENFKVGFTTKGMDDKFQKKTPKRVPGGVVLVSTTFTIS